MYFGLLADWSRVPNLRFAAGCPDVNSGNKEYPEVEHRSV
jgi:hypothetical protein